MRRITLQKLFVVGLIGLWTAGCERLPEMPLRTLTYNQSVAKATNQLLLLNIIRASQREPRYFTRIDSNQAKVDITPSISLSLPFNPIKNGSATLQTQGTVGNSLTLQNMDDKKYQVGANQPIDVQTINYYWQEGFQGDLLGLLFFSAIEIPVRELPILESATIERCKKKPRSHYCTAQNGQTVADLNECFGRPRTVWRDGVEYALFSNNPARDMGNTTGKQNADREQCFVATLRALLVLGLHPAEHTTTKKLQKDLPRGVIISPRFVAEMIKQSAQIVRNRDGKYDVVKESVTMKLAFDAEASKNIATRILHEKRYRDVVNIHPEDDQKPLVAATGKKPDRLTLDDVKIAIDVRSFESLIYFLGEVVRAEVADPAISPSVLPVVTSKNWQEPVSIYIAPLFIARKGTPGEDARIAVTDDHGVQYWIPRLYDDRMPSRTDAGTSSNACPERYSFEYPTHHSMTVLTIVNELWALQKEPAERPVQTLNVGG